MERHYDIAIIGSGLGGLVSAYILAKNGYKVAVFEKQPVIGGCLQTFRRDGIAFETGMHYIGSMHEGGALHRFFRYLDLLDIPLSPLDTSGFDIVSYRGERYPFANGRERFVETLSQYFPSQREALRRYVATLAKVTESSPLYSFRHTDDITFLHPDYIQTSVNGTLANITPDPVLQNVLAGNLPLYAGLENTTPFYVYALICDFYMQSAHRIIGGSDAIAKHLAASVARFGGEIFTSQCVERIECDAARATGITLRSGERVAADNIISDIHPAAVIRMTDSPLLRRAYRERITSLRNTVSNFTVYIKFRPDTMPYMNHNLYHYTGGVWGCENYRANDFPRNFLYMHQCCEPDQKYARGALLMSYMRYDDVARWADTRVGRRGEEYEAFKRDRAERMLAELERQMPGTTAAIERYWTSSPLTYRDYTGTEQGSTYGIVHDCTQPSQSFVAPRTKIPNLFLTGQNISAHGILGVIIGAIVTCSELLGLGKVVKQIEKG